MKPGMSLTRRLGPATVHAAVSPAIVLQLFVREALGKYDVRAKILISWVTLPINVTDQTAWPSDSTRAAIEHLEVKHHTPMCWRQVNSSITACAGYMIFRNKPPTE